MTLDEDLKKFNNPHDLRNCHCGTCKQAVEVAVKIVKAHPEIFDNGAPTPGELNGNCPAWGVQIAQAILRITQSYFIMAMRDGMGVDIKSAEGFKTYNESINNINKNVTVTMTDEHLLETVIHPIIDSLMDGLTPSGHRKPH